MTTILVSSLTYIPVRYLDSIQSNEFQKFMTYTDINGTIFYSAGIRTIQTPIQ